MCARARVCVHAYSRGSLRSEVDAIYDASERYERAPTLSWRRVRLDEVCLVQMRLEVDEGSDWGEP